MGTLTINTTAQQDQRIVAAFGKYLGLPGNATGAQVRQEVYNFIRLTVQEQERKVAIQAATDAAVAGLSDLGPSS